MFDFKVKPASDVPNDHIYPGPAQRRKAIYPLGTMEVGHAFVVPADHDGAKGMPASPGVSRVQNAAYSISARTGRKFRCRRQRDGSVRVERTA